MHTYTIDCYENLNSDFWHQFKDGDVLRQVATLFIEGDSDAAACEGAYTVGNKMDADRYGNRWKNTMRSMSVGDVVAITHVDGVAVAPRIYAVVGVGFQPIEAALPQYRPVAF